MTELQEQLVAKLLPALFQPALGIGQSESAAEEFVLFQAVEFE